MKMFYDNGRWYEFHPVRCVHTYSHGPVWEGTVGHEVSPKEGDFVFRGNSTAGWEDALKQAGLYTNENGVIRSRPLCHGGFGTCLHYTYEHLVQRCAERVGDEWNGLCAYQAP